MSGTRWRWVTCGLLVLGLVCSAALDAGARGEFNFKWRSRHMLLVAADGTEGCASTPSPCLVITLYARSFRIGNHPRIPFKGLCTVSWQWTNQAGDVVAGGAEQFIVRRPKNGRGPLLRSDEIRPGSEDLSLQFSSHLDSCTYRGVTIEARP